jgi:hypothetical protein
VPTGGDSAIASTAEPSRRGTELARALLRDPLTWLLAALAALYLLNLCWGLPATDGWDDDGVAPRDFLYGLYRSYAPGQHYTYPPAHLLLLAVITLPVWLPVLLRARSLTPAELVPAFVTPETMTALAVAARLVECAMALGLVWAVGKLAEEAAGRRAGLFAAAVCGLDGVLVYYSHTSNLDVPALFWAALALLQLARGIVRSEPRRLRRVAVFAALAVATKDQAAGVFTLCLPAALVLWAGWVRPASDTPRSLARETVLAFLIGALIYGVAGGALLNPTGFLARVPTLFAAGAEYAAGIHRSANPFRLLAAAFSQTPDFWPWPLMGLAVVGIVWLPRLVTGRARLLAALLPVLAALSFTVTFTLAARRTEHRFVLPQFVFLAVPAGLALGALWDARRWTRAARPLVLGALVLSSYAAVRVVLSTLRDPRYAVEAYLLAQVRPGDRIETYGSNVYLPRFPRSAQVERVDDTQPVVTRNVLPGVTEVQAPFAEAQRREPTWIVAPRAYTRLWLDPEGHLDSQLFLRRAGNTEARAYFAALRTGGVPGYAHVATFACPEGFWGAPRIHASTCEEVDVLRRVSTPGR